MSIESLLSRFVVVRTHAQEGIHTLLVHGEDTVDDLVCTVATDTYDERDTPFVDLLDGADDLILLLGGECRRLRRRPYGDDEVSTGSYL